MNGCLARKEKIALIAVDLGLAFDAQGFHPSPSYVPTIDRDAPKWVRFSSQTPPIKKKKNPRKQQETFLFRIFLFTFQALLIQNRALSHTFIFTPRLYIDLNRSRDRLRGRELVFPSPAAPGQPARCVFVGNLESPPGVARVPRAQARRSPRQRGVPPRPGSGGGAVTVTPSDIMSAAARQTCPSPLPLQPYGAVNSRAGTGFCCCCVRVPRPFSARASPGCGRGSPAPLPGRTSPRTGRGTGAAAEGPSAGPPLGDPRPGVPPGKQRGRDASWVRGLPREGAQASALSQPCAGSIN